DTHVVVDCVGEEDVDTHERIIQSLIVHPLEQTLLALYLTVIREMQAHPEDYKILVFLPTARNAMFFTTILNQLGLGIEVMEIHSRKNQTQRTLTSDTYRRAKRAILMSSDISARGVDYPNVTLIVQLGAPTTKEVYVQRLGRTGRADSAGAGVLLLCAFERPFLSCLADLPIRDISESFVENAATKECAALEAVIRAASCGVDAEMCAHTYLAWLKAFNGPLRKAFKWSKQDLVDHSNLFALHVLGRAEPIPVPREHMKDMGLKDCKGLYMVDASEYSEFDSTSSLASMNVEVVQEDVWTVRPNNKIINPVFRQGSKAVGEALAALSSADIQNLEAELAACAGGMVIVGGFELSAEMVTIVKVVAPSLSRNSSSSTLKSLTALSRNPSASNMKGMGSTSSLAPMAEGEEKEEPVPTEAEIEVASARVQAAGGMMRELTKTRGQGGEEGEAMYKTAVAELTAAKAELKRMVALGKKAKK
ncbi:P-loop containing nucleoside triphosphate hydrolase protein, partial [Ochromonadaceae sp. CCMP2298]